MDSYEFQNMDVLLYFQYGLQFYEQSGDLEQDGCYFEYADIVI